MSTMQSATALSAAEQQTLLRWARQSIAAAVSGARADKIPEAELTDALRAPQAAFVTLKKHGELRGCIGLMDFQRPLWENVVAAARAAALEDPRFPTVETSELSELQHEITVLQPPRPIRSIDEFDHLRHGIIITKGWNHGLFLPQVAREQGWDKLKTLEMVCWKAGLPPDAWRAPDARLEIFDGFNFEEPEHS